jgi:gas vesicle protein
MPKRLERKQDEGLGLFVVGAALGGLLGAIGAVWFAPQSGEETRHDIQEKVTNIGDDIEHVTADARRRIEGDSIEDSIRAGKAEARKFQQAVHR